MESSQNASNAMKLPQGILVPLFTPFDEEGEIDRAGLVQLVDFYLQAGVHGIVALGADGQGPAMRADQRRSTAEVILDRVSGRIPVVVHIGTADLQTTLQLTRHADALRPVALALSPPYYFSDHTPYEIAAHFNAVGEATDIPLCIYDAPRYAGIAITPGTAYRLMKTVPSIAGLIGDDATFDLLLQYLRVLPPPFATISGSIECLLPLGPYGLAGVSDVICALFPEMCMALWNSVTTGKFADGFAQQRQLNEIAAVIDRYVTTFGRTVYRDVLRMRGLSLNRYPRWPAQELDDDARRRLSSELQALGAFGLPRAGAPPPPPAEEQAAPPVEKEPAAGEAAAIEAEATTEETAEPAEK